MSFTLNALAVLEKRYLLRENGKVVESPKEMMHRVAKTVAEAEYLYGKSPEYVNQLTEVFEKHLLDLKFLPNTPCLLNAGARSGQLSACFVLPVEDSLDAIMQTLTYAAKIHQTGGGTGFSYASLREEGALVSKSQGVSSGPIPFMALYNEMTEAINQGGARRGANMGSLICTHPDFIKFISLKSDLNKMNNFNLSCLLTDDFMSTAEADGDFYYKDPRTGAAWIKDGKYQSYKAKEVLSQIVHYAWLTGEPGVLFKDRADRDHPLIDGEYFTTNPCGEQFLDPYDTCNLGSINLSKFVKAAKPEIDEKATVDWESLKATVQLAVRFLDNMVDVNTYVLPQIEEQTLANRRIGLGVMGWADMLILLDIPYGSDESFNLATKVMLFIRDTATDMSTLLATEKGEYPNFFRSKRYERGFEPIRNSNLFTVAPTGTLSIIAGCSSGIEPLFGIAFHRFQAGFKMQEVNPLFMERVLGESYYSLDLIDRIIENGSCQGFTEIPECVRKVYVVAHDLSPEQHVMMQATFQNAMGPLGNAISKTINFPEEATEEDIYNAYMLAWKLGCKGLTVYRNNSRNSQPLYNSERPIDKAPEKEYDEFNGISYGRTIEIPIPHYGTMRVNLGRRDPGGKGPLVEVIATVGKNGGIGGSEAEACGRLASVHIRSKEDGWKDVVRQFRGIGSGGVAFWNGRAVLSIADGIAQAIEEEMTGQVEKIKEKDLINHSMVCSQCGSKLAFQNGCFNCVACGFSKCG